MSAAPWPQVCTVGVDGFLVRFGDQLSEAANRAALAFRAALEEAALPGVAETSTSLASTYLRFDVLTHDHAEVEIHLDRLLTDRDWFAATLPQGRRLWRIPTVYGTDLAPQLDEAAACAGLTRNEAIRTLSETRVRIQTIGFAPGQPYLGALPECWDIPRQTALTPHVPVGALTVALRQFVLFSVAAPTGWRHVGQTAFHAFRADSDHPFVLAPGDEVVFEATPLDAFSALQACGPDGGATCEPLP
ncbi:MAG: 5-oxoprolinase subunit B family protein [Paracoccaceae bacterium]